MQLSLKDKVAIITGAGRGVGAAIAKALAQSSVKVAVNDLNPDRANHVATEINDLGGTAIAVAADVANKFQCVHLIETTRDEWGQLDILVNNAAVMPRAAILKMDEWDWTRCFEVNLKGTFFMSQLCGRVMVDENGHRGGSIINISSTAGNHLPLEGRAAYCANSAGVVGFARECAREFAAYNIRVNTILTNVLEVTMGEVGGVNDTAVITSQKAKQARAVTQSLLSLCTDSTISGTITTI